MSVSNKQEKVESDDEEEIQLQATKGRKVIVILDMAQLETVKTKKGDFQLLNCDDHISIMKRNNKDPSLYRPDILHQVRVLARHAVPNPNTHTYTHSRE
jgi:rRNA pseudouridine-1189 N-methylase Emg1 (Nep1/Mra1 family)